MTCGYRDRMRRFGALSRGTTGHYSADASVLAASARLMPIR